MALDTLTPTKTGTTYAPQGSALHELAKTIRTGAVAKALSSRRANASNDALLEIELRRPAVVETVKDSIAQSVARALAAHDAQVQTVYAYDPTANADNESGEDRLPDATIHLLVRVPASSAALQSFIAALDQALTESLKELPSLTFQVRESILDVNLLTEKDVQQHTGYASLLSSTYAPAIKIWER